MCANAQQLAATLYRLHEAGQPYDEPMRTLGALTGQVLSRSEVDGAFGSMASEDWAINLLLLPQPLPSDLSDEELVEMVGHILSVDTPEWLQHWLIRCVEHATNCAQVIDIIYSPRDVFGDEEHDELSPAEVVAQAKKRPRRILVTPPGEP